ncbi:MAG: AI-2E family transporter [Bacillota bacterium]|nr:AI-2E family transporter [Bacillota bacterium]
MKKTLLYFSIISIFVMLFFFGGKLLHLSAPIFIALILTYIANPFVTFCSKRLPRALGILLFYLIIIGLFTVTIWVVLPSALKSLTSLISSLPKFSKQLEDSFSFLGTDIQKSITDALYGFLKGRVSNLMNIIDNTLSSLASFGVAVVLSFFFLKDPSQIKNSFIYILPSNWLPPLSETVREINCAWQSFIRGQLLVSIILSIITVIALWILKIDYAFILGIVSGIFNLIPAIGPVISAIPIVIIAYLKSPASAMLSILALVLIQVLDNNFISPKIKSGCVGISPVAAFISMYFGAGLFGFSGIILGIPIFAAIKIIVRRALAMLS